MGALLFAVAALAVGCALAAAGWAITHLRVEWVS